MKLNISTVEFAGFYRWFFERQFMRAAGEKSKSINVKAEQGLRWALVNRLCSTSTNFHRSSLSSTRHFELERAVCSVIFPVSIVQKVTWHSPSSPVNKYGEMV